MATALRHFICSISTIPKSFKKSLRDTFECADDPCLIWFNIRMPNVKLCLTTRNEELVSWACFSHGKDIEPKIFAWTKSEHRKQGYATATLTYLMEQEGWRIRDRAVTAYNSTIRTVLNRLGFSTDWTTTCLDKHGLIEYAI